MGLLISAEKLSVPVSVEAPIFRKIEAAALKSTQRVRRNALKIVAHE